MLEEVRIADVATYPKETQRLDNLRQINFIFGTNGSGKTTISRVIADPGRHPTCGLTWRDGRALEALVYNSDFVDRNFVPQMRGIFTLGEVEADALKNIEETRAKVEEIEGQISNLNQTLGAADNSTGKRADLSTLRNDFEGECWKIKTEHDGHFQRAFEGLRTSKAKFCDRVLEEGAGNTSDLHAIDDLKTRAQTVFAEGVERLDPLPVFDARELLVLENATVLAKKVVGKEDIDVGALIRRLGNSDWVRRGLEYVEGAGGPCPFCQKELDAELLGKLNAFFDEAYIADIAEIARIQESSETFSNAVLEVVDTVLSSGSAHIDVDVMRPLADRLRSLIRLNKQHVDRKRKEPSAPVTLEPLAEALAAISSSIDKANQEIGRHNTLVENLVAERQTLTSEIWRRVTEDRNEVVDAYAKAKGGLDKALGAITANIEAKTAALTEARATLAALEKKVTSVQPTVTEINSTLASFGFNSFRLATAGDKNQHYAIVRGDGSDARETLSEGERSFISFLYFYHLVRGSITESGVTTDRVVVFDDPVSSLDSDVLFIVSALIKRVLVEASGDDGRVKQVFVLTHNIYFHKEVSFDTGRNKDQRRRHETFWTVRKVDDASTRIQGHSANPIRTSYELLWDEVRDPKRSNLTIQNVLRRILEHYFTILGNMDKDAVVAKFEGRDQQVCASLFSWINDGSHSFADDLYVAADDAAVERYLRVFKGIFDQTGHGAHYRMMFGPEVPDLEEVQADIVAAGVAAAAELMAEIGLGPEEPGAEPDAAAVAE